MIKKLLLHPFRIFASCGQKQDLAFTTDVLLLSVGLRRCLDYPNYSLLYYTFAFISIAKRCSYNSPAQRSIQPRPNPDPSHPLIALKQERPMM